MHKKFTLEMFDKKYIHLKLEKTLLYLKNENKLGSRILRFRISIDGVPMYKSNGQQFWPILASIEFDEFRLSPFIIGIYGEKPANYSFLRH